MPVRSPVQRARRSLLALAAASPLLVSGCSVSRLVAAVTPTDHYRRTDGLAYGGGERQRLDLYVPNDIAARGEGAHAPVVVFLYGGSWQRGQRANYAFVGEALASRGFVVAIADYRVYPDVTFPAFVEDGAAAVAWMRRNARRYGGDPARLVVAGHSAGAHIAMLVALDRDYLAAAGEPDAVAGAIGLAGPYDFLPLTSDSAESGIRLAGHAAAHATDPLRPRGRAAAVAPAWRRRHDRLPRNAERLAARVRSAGGRADVKLYAGVGHVGLIARLAAPFRDGEAVLDDIAAFARTATA